MTTSIVWNPSRLCVWNCDFCCLNANKNTDKTNVNLKENSNFIVTGELNFKDKIKIIDQLIPGEHKLDFGGGEFLLNPLHIDLVEYASNYLGSENIGMSISGAFVNEDLINRLSGKVGEIEMTMDCEPTYFYDKRPAGYHESAAKALKLLKNNNFYVGVQTVLTKNNMHKDIIKNLYDWLVDNSINKWSLLRYFPVGRGDRFQDIMPTYDEYCDTVEYIQSISAKGNVLVHFQYLLPGHEKYTLNCRAVKQSVGILPDGTVIACFWALNENMRPTDNKLILGKLPKDNINDLLKNEKACYWRNKEHKCFLFKK